MRDLGLLIVCLAVLAPAYAQDEGQTQGEAAGGDAAAQEQTYDDYGVNSGTSMADLLEQTADEPADAGEAPADDAADGNDYGSDYGSTDFGDASGSEDPFGAPEPAREPLELYVGVDHVWTRAAFSNPDLKAEFGADELDSSMLRLRAGVRLFKRIGLELHYGGSDTENADLEADEYNTDSYYAVYLVPTGVLFNTIEVGAAIGYASTDLARAGASETLDGASFGVNFELPLHTGESFELRLGGGGTVYRAYNSARVYGYHAGLRVDFEL